MKAATTSIAEGLARHPDVFVSAIKEPSYFATDVVQSDYAEWYRNTIFNPDRHLTFTESASRMHLAFIAEQSTYLKLFKDANGRKARGEASSYYLMSSEAARNIAEAVPDAKIVMVLREPVSRARSQFLMNLTNGETDGSFEAELRREAEMLEGGETPWGKCYCLAGCYYEQVRRYFDHFDRGQILVLLYDDIVADFDGALQRILKHLDVDPSLLAGEAIHTNASQRAPRFARVNRLLYQSGLKDALIAVLPAPVRRVLGKLYYRPMSANKAPIGNADIGQLRQYFKQDVRALGALIDRNLDHWLAAQPEGHSN